MQVFNSPTTNLLIINQRQALIKNLSGSFGQLSFDRTNMDFVEGYLRQSSKARYYSPIIALKESIKYFSIQIKTII